MKGMNSCETVLVTFDYFQIQRTMLWFAACPLVQAIQAQALQVVRGPIQGSYVVLSAAFELSTTIERGEYADHGNEHAAVARLLSV